MSVNAWYLIFASLVCLRLNTDSGYLAESHDVDRRGTTASDPFAFVSGGAISHELGVVYRWFSVRTLARATLLTQSTSIAKASGTFWSLTPFRGLLDSTRRAFLRRLSLFLSYKGSP